MTVIPIILSGGSGARLWPVSRASKPKQFLNFGGEHSLIRQTVLRCQSDLFDPRPIIVCAQGHRFLMAEELREIDVEADIILEPAPRNSAAAIAAGCLRALERTPDAVVLVLAADHQIRDQVAFSDAVGAAFGDCQAGFLVTFGVYPTRPATGYGYILPGEPLRANGCLKVSKFVEKPSLATAELYLAEGYLWNSGNFLFGAQTCIDELAILAPDIVDAVSQAYHNAQTDLDFLRLEEHAFKRSPAISIDYALMERTGKAAVYPVDYLWSDVGSWQAVWEVMEKDSAGNVIVGDGEIIDGGNNLVHSRDKLTTIIGVDDIAVITTRDSVLVTSKEDSEKVKDLVTRLQENGRSEANEALKQFRPWGNYERLDIGDGYQVKRIVIKPGGVLSLQKHRQRAEHWVVVEGTPQITLEDKITTLQPNQSIYVPLGCVHRLANWGDRPAVLIEVQSGAYLGEDDIIRIEDVYNRD